MGAGMKQRTIDPLELERLVNEQQQSKRGLFGQYATGISRGTYYTIKNRGMGSEKKLQAIARALGLKGISAFLPVGIQGAEVHERRCDRGWTEAELAERCRSGRGRLPESITAATIESIEAGNNPPPDGSNELCRRLAAALGCKFEDLAYDPSAAGPVQIINELSGPLSELWVRRIFAAQHRKTGGIFAGLDNRSFTQPWSTAQALVGALQVPGVAARYRDEIRRIFIYLTRWRYPFGVPIEKLAPEEEQGWALTEDEVIPVPVTEITCWVLVAYAYALRNGVVGVRETEAYLGAEVEVLLSRQYVLAKGRNLVGGFCPTVHVCDQNQRTYSTVLALWALVELLPLIREELIKRRRWDNALAAINRGAEWLIATRDKTFGWVPKPFGGKRSRYPGLTAQALFLLTLLRQSGLGLKVPVGYTAAVRDFLLEARDFSRIWEFRDPAGDISINSGDVLVAGTPPYRLEGSEFFWAPWTLALVGLLIRVGYPGSKRIHESVSYQLTELRDRMAKTAYKEMSKSGRYVFGTPEIGETLFGVSWLNPGGPKHAIRSVTN